MVHTSETRLKGDGLGVPKRLREVHARARPRAARARPRQPRGTLHTLLEIGGLASAFVL